eukprot:jgi/Botrbrau1/15079/Bobra.0286s0008.1
MRLMPAMLRQALSRLSCCHNEPQRFVVAPLRNSVTIILPSTSGRLSHGAANIYTKRTKLSYISVAAKIRTNQTSLHSWEMPLESPQKAFKLPAEFYHLLSVYLGMRTSTEFLI